MRSSDYVATKMSSVQQCVIVCNGASHLGLRSCVSFKSDRFACGERNVILSDSVRDRDIIIFQCFKNPNEDLMELFIMIDAVKRSGANKITVVLPMFPYARQDRRHDSGTPISAKVICKILSTIGIDRLICLDLHADQIQGFMPNYIQFDHITTRSFFAWHLQNKIPDLQDWIIAAPDSGSVRRNKRLATSCNIRDLCYINKTRVKKNEIESMSLVGDVRGRKVLMFDDMIDTAGTLEQAFNLLESKGAVEIKAVATHGVLSPPSYMRLQNRDIIITNSVPIAPYQIINGTEYQLPDTIEIIPLQTLLLELIHRIQENLQLSPIMDSWIE